MKKMNKKTVIGLGVAGLALLGGASYMYTIGLKMGIKALTGVYMIANSRALDKFSNETDLQTLKQFLDYAGDEMGHVSIDDALKKYDEEKAKRNK